MSGLRQAFGFTISAYFSESERAWVGLIDFSVNEKPQTVACVANAKSEDEAEEITTRLFADPESSVSLAIEAIIEKEVGKTIVSRGAGLGLIKGGKA